MSIVSPVFDQIATTEQLQAFPLRCEWDMLHPAGVKPYPGSEPITTTPPGPVLDLALLADRHGWSTRITGSRGHVPHATTGRPSAAPKEMWAVRCARGERRAVAVREDGAWHSLWVWSAHEFFQKLRLLEDFRAALSR